MRPCRVMRASLRLVVVLFSLLSLSAACSQSSEGTTLIGPSPGNGGKGGDAATTPAANGSDASAPSDPASDSGLPAPEDRCSEAAKLVYLVDESGEFMSFRPDTGVFTTIGTLDCPTMGGGIPGLPLPLPGLGSSPFSMSVDRSGTAWVLYSTGELFRVDTKDASCSATSRTAGAEGFNTFGMGFATKAAGGNDETLYVAGAGGGSFGSLDLSTLMVSTLGSVNGSPELTGTGSAELWGFFPDTSPPRIDLMDKSSGAAQRTIPLTSLNGTPTAWAFAFWGGRFWIFLQRAADPATVVYRVDAATGELTTSIPNTGKTIVGAGVSTCAPVQVI